MIQQFHFLVSAQEKQKQGLTACCTCVHSSGIHKSQELEAIQMHEENVIFTYIQWNIIQPPKGKYSYTCYNMD